MGLGDATPQQVGLPRVASTRVEGHRDPYDEGRICASRGERQAHHTLFSRGQFSSPPGLGCGSLDVTFTLLRARLLKPHEEFLPELVEETRQAIEADGFVREPLLVEKEHHVILDGHHRYGALLELDIRWIPVYLVDYEDDAVRVETWPGGDVDRVTKEEVLEAALSGNRFPPKTTRHRVELPPGDARVKLKDLRAPES
ncbi:MAG: ParB N-terminal domain-containing protein [Thermoplasmata archaeon]